MKRKNKSSRGRPPKKIDFGVVERLAELGNTMEDIAWILGCSKQTIYTNMNNDPEFMDAYKRGFAKGNERLRRAQFDAAVEDKVPSLLIWLGKQRLGQRDNVDLSIERFVKKQDDESLLKMARELLGAKDGNIADKNKSIH
jgi:hypothetical protein